MKLHTKLAIAAVLALAGSQAWAQTSANIQVQANVAQTCTISAGSLNFGNYDPVSDHATNPLDATTTLSIACTKGASGVTVSLSLGGHFSGSQRRMEGPTGDLLNYDLYQPASGNPDDNCAYTTPWSNGANAFTPTATWNGATALSFKVCGRVPGGQNVEAGTYTDTVVAEVHF